jgi:serine/threonine protein kinase/formylglycine-generating enzyme required for sulfatase activity
MPDRTLTSGDFSPPPPSPPVAAPAPFPNPDGYEILRELGRGGMGVVYHARQIALHREVALKVVLGGGYSGALAEARFQVEAEAVARVHHPNVVQVYEFGRHAGQPFFALEYVGGGTLADHLKRAGKFPPRDAAAMAAKLAGAVAAAHAQGIIHRDLKPANVLIAECGTRSAGSKPDDETARESALRTQHSALEPKITDFGLAKIGASDLTATGAIFGTPAYMAPEQASGNARTAGAAVDVYALGIILYELLTGRRPFEGETHSVIVQQITAVPRSPRALVRSVPRDLETVCLKCLEKDPKQRYQTADALAADLTAYLEGKPISARPVGPVERFVKLVRRNPWPTATAGVFLASVVAVGVEAWRERGRRDLDRAKDLVKTLETSQLQSVDSVVTDIDRYRDLTRPLLREMAEQPITTRAGLHARLALLADDPGRVAELVAYLPDCRPFELLPVRDFLKPHAVAAAPPLWGVLTDDSQAVGRRLRAGCALAGLTPDDPRWPAAAPALTGWVVTGDPLEVAVWAEAVHPILDHLFAPLVAWYAESRRKVESGRLVTAEIAAEATALDLAANLLAQAAADRPAGLAGLVTSVAPRHLHLFEKAFEKYRDRVVVELTAELAAPVRQDWAAIVRGEGADNDPVGAVGGAAAGLAVSIPDLVMDARAKRRATAAAVLLKLDLPAAAWPMFRLAPDPSDRSYLLQRLAVVGIDPAELVRRFDAEPDVSARRALVLALGDYAPDRVPAGDRAALADKLVALYRRDPDPGLHAAIDWLLRQHWGRAADLARADAELAGPPAPGRDWFVSAEGQTFAVVRGPVEFEMGYRDVNPDRTAGTPAHRVRIPRSFAVATKEVTAGEFLRFRPDHEWTRRYSPDPDGPALSVTWYRAAEYCNWLSEREGVPRDQWCYEPNPAGEYAEGMRATPGHLGRTGYRLPTEAEWEYACRAGTRTARSYGRTADLMPRYGWYARLSDDRAWPVGRLRPNDLGLFDALGNAQEWCDDPGRPYDLTPHVDGERRPNLPVTDAADRVLRGGSFMSGPAALRCADRDATARATGRFFTFGFRPARTVAAHPGGS